ncbi:MAG: cobaltochelatase subunit CobN [Gemmatimonadaceae bacterium]|nr:cobaltochelatase subunit CobN [Gemmatimonadaceae bacterium]
MAALGGDLESAALRVFSNADGAYGSNVNLLVETGQWRTRTSSPTSSCSARALPTA